jgi:phosphate transport system protein
MAAAEVRELKGRLAAYCALVGGMLEKSRNALLDREPGIPRRIVEVDEPRANETELELEEECTALIAQRQPMARDLRAILMILRITNDLERIADHAVNIAEAVADHVKGSSLRPDDALLAMFAETIRMLERAVRSFTEEDARLGQAVCESDGVVDALATDILERASAAMERDPSVVAQGLAQLKIAANLERVADLSTNIGEDVIYMTEGRVIKHHREEAR